MNYTEDHDILRRATRQEVGLDALHAWFMRQGAKRSDDLNQYIGVMLAGCLRLGIDPWVVYGQFSLETENGTSYWWENNLNPAGIGVVGVAGQPGNGSNSQKWLTGSDAAFGHLAHLVAYLWPMDWTESGWPDAWPDPWVADKRFMTPIEQGYFATDLASLGQQKFRDGMWRGWSDNDPNYGAKVAARANQLYTAAGKDTKPMTVTFGRVPHPAHTKRIATNNTAWNDLGPRVIRGVVWHRMIGTLWGTDGYFRGGAPALTDYGIGVAAEEPNDAGTILMWNDPGGRRAPWANGTVSNPYGDGKLFLDRYGVNAVNRDLVSIEISGRSWNTPLDAKARASIVALTAYWADQYKVSHETFPIIPSEGNRSFVIWHQEFTIGTGKVCPGNVVMAETSALIAAVKEMLRGYQESAEPVPPPPDYAKPSPVPKGTQLINDHLFLAPGGKTVQVATAPRLWADAAAPDTGPPFPKGHKFAQEDFTHYVQGTDGNLWVVLTDGSRFPALAFVSE